MHKAMKDVSDARAISLCVLLSEHVKIPCGSGTRTLVEPLSAVPLNDELQQARASVAKAEADVLLEITHKLSLLNCKIQAIDSSIRSCTELRELTLAHNEIRADEESDGFWFKQIFVAEAEMKKRTNKAAQNDMMNNKKMMMKRLQHGDNDDDINKKKMMKKAASSSDF
nr:DNA mismatch repair protein MutS, core [Tanacetum cinerariifolium]